MKKINVIYYSLTALESQTEAREKEEGGELQGAIYVHRTIGHVTQVVMHLLKIAHVILVTASVLYLGLWTQTSDSGVQPLDIRLRIQASDLELWTKACQ